MITKDLHDIDSADLQSLVSNRVAERKTLEYKASLPSNASKDKKEFLADVSSFANASGGDLIFGMEADKNTGAAKKLVGLAQQARDQEILKWESVIRDGIRPRIPSVDLWPVEVSNLAWALIVRVPKSWMAPHRVSFEGHNKFYARSSKGKHEMDVEELRVAFTTSASLADRIRRFREDRLAAALADETPVPLSGTAKIVLHLIPLGALDRIDRYDLVALVSKPEDDVRITPISGRAIGSRYTLEGFVRYGGKGPGQVSSYLQVFRNGIVEAVDCSLLGGRGGERSIPSVHYEGALIRALASYLYLLQRLRVEPPVFLFLTLLGVRGYYMDLGGGDVRGMPGYETYAIDRDVLLIPETMIEAYDLPVDKLLRPVFDAVWNACGFQGSHNFDSQGDWHAGG